MAKAAPPGGLQECNHGRTWKRHMRKVGMCSICERSIFEHKVKKLSREIFIVLLVSYLVEGIF